ncbi:tryptophan--tRNA ligase [Patescibacteria group bacterium]|nr:tryptophan--tRNA ligase [Patescibacteria group bacterium]
MEEKVQKYSEKLKKLGIEHKVLPHPQLVSVAKVQEYLGYGMADAGSTLIMKVGEKFVAVMRRGDTKLDNNKVKKHLNVSSLRMATEEEFVKITDSPLGAGPVYMPDIDLYIDNKIFGKEYINAGSGSLLYTIRYKTADLTKIPRSFMVDFTSDGSQEIKYSGDKFLETISALKETKIEYELIKHPPIKTVEEGLAFLKIKPSQGVSTLIARTEKVYVSILRRDDHRIDLDKVKRVLDSDKIGLCPPDEVLKVTGCQVGYVSPYNSEMTTVADETIRDNDYIYLGTGSPEYDLKIKPADLFHFTRAKTDDIKLEGIGRTRSRILSGITPSGDGTLHIGNYLGAVKQFIEFAKAYDCFLMVADLHALTTIQDKVVLQRNIQNLILNELALLGDLTNIVFFRQSDVPMHAELTWIFSNVTPLGLLRRAHAYKDKLAKDVMEDDINLGLFNYPILMTSDILLYKPDYVPVGKDQKQHIEICRDVAGRFNKTFKAKVFPLPAPYIPEEVAVIMGTDGKRKMSKSLGNIISIFDDEKVIKRQVTGTYTDPTRIHPTDLGHVEGNMVFAYLKYFAGQTGGYKGKQKEEAYEELEKDYKAGKVSDVTVKEELFKALMVEFAPARERYRELKSNPNKVKKILRDGAEKAREVAGQTMMEVREAVGLTNQYSFFKY